MSASPDIPRIPSGVKPTPFLPAERWRAIRPLFDEAMDLSGAARTAFVEGAFPGDDSLRSELRDLVASYDADGGLLDSSAPLGELLSDLDEEDPTAGREGAFAAVPAGATLGPYRLVREIGSGGMGTVYLAERNDGAFVREVAVKLLRPGLEGQESDRRFRQERQILARLEHPGIARLLDGGTAPDGRPYLVMEFVEGQPCDDYCEERRLGVTDRLKLFLQVTDAVQFAHQKLIVHRDLKPTNILVTKGGRAKLLDFGIAKLLEDSEDGTLTHVGRQVLTLSHGSPEQVRGDPVSTASDVYSLGVLLYELLAGKSPYVPAGGSRAALERAVLEGEPIPPSACREKLHLTGQQAPAAELAGDLDAIVLKALRKTPAERYPSVEAFAQDVKLYLEGWPVDARRGNVRYRAAKFARRHAGKLAVAGLVVAVSAAGVLLHERRLARERNVAQREAEKAFVLTDFAFSMIEGASAGHEGGKPLWLPAAELQARVYLRVDPEVGAAMLRDVARLQMARKELEAAGRLLEEVRVAQGGIQGLSTFESAETLRTLGKLASLRGKPEEAAKEYDRALLLFRETLPQEGGRAVHTIIDLGNAFLTLNRLDSAAEAYRKAIKLMGTNDADPQWGRARNNLGIVFLRRRDWAEAARLMGEALPNVERSLDESNSELGDVLVTYAQTLDHLGDRVRARALAERGLAVYRRTLAPGDPRIAEAEDLLATTGR